MHTLYNQSDFNNIISRIQKLSPDSQRQWGKMNAGQMLAHCYMSMETALGNHNIKRVFIGRIIAPLIRKTILSEKPFAKNTPTDGSYRFPVDVNFEEYKKKAIASTEKFYEGGAAKCTTWPHAFFGNFTPEQWGIFQWKHWDHHLRQFGV